MSPSGEGQDCRHEFPVEDIGCNLCGGSAAYYMHHLKARASALEHLVIAANEQTRKQEARADSADFTCSEAQRSMLQYRASHRALLDVLARLEAGGCLPADRLGTEIRTLLMEWSL